MGGGRERRGRGDGGIKWEAEAEEDKYRENLGVEGVRVREGNVGNTVGETERGGGGGGMRDAAFY